MSRLGKLPIKLPEGVTANFDKNEFKVKGPKGELSVAIKPVVSVKIAENEINIGPDGPEKIKNVEAMWGLYWSLVRNAVIGVSEGFEKKLEINGVGYRVAVAGNKLNMNLGLSHPVEFPLPEGISASVEGNVLSLSGADKQAVGEVASQIRRLRKPEPYKGKGIKYVDEILIRKAGKTAGKGE